MDKVISLGSFGSLDVSYKAGVFSLVETTNINGVVTAGAQINVPTVSLLGILGAVITKASPALSGIVAFLEPLIAAGLAAL